MRIKVNFREWLIKSVTVSRIAPTFTADNCGNSRANTCKRNSSKQRCFFSSDQKQSFSGMRQIILLPTNRIYSRIKFSISQETRFVAAIFAWLENKIVREASSVEIDGRKKVDRCIDSRSKGRDRGFPIETRGDPVMQLHGGSS